MFINNTADSWQTHSYNVSYPTAPLGVFGMTLANVSSNPKLGMANAGGSLTGFSYSCNVTNINLFWLGIGY